eukprot:m51a1_g12243 hypothetical protein (162) ;mRNA; f:126298-126783
MKEHYKKAAHRRTSRRTKLHVAPSNRLSPEQRACVRSRLSEAAAEGKRGISSVARDLAAEFNVTPEVVRGIYHRSLKSPGRMHRNRLLTDEQEMVLATAIDACSLRNVPLSLKEFLDLVHTVHPELADHSLWSWAPDFLARWHNRIGARTAQGLRQTLPPD